MVDFGVIWPENGRGNIVQKLETMTRWSPKIEHHLLGIVPSGPIAIWLPGVVNGPRHGRHFLRKIPRRKSYQPVKNSLRQWDPDEAFESNIRTCSSCPSFHSSSILHNPVGFNIFSMNSSSPHSSRYAVNPSSDCVRHHWNDKMHRLIPLYNV